MTFNATTNQPEGLEPTSAEGNALGPTATNPLCPERALHSRDLLLRSRLDLRPVGPLMSLDSIQYLLNPLSAFVSGTGK
jgi:hypothetical protein